MTIATRKLFQPTTPLPLTFRRLNVSYLQKLQPRYVTTTAKLPEDPLVFGFWKVPKEVCADVCYRAIKAGYRRLDGACDYGNEVEVGEGISRAINDGICQREDLFITSKLWNTYHNPEHVPMAFNRTLSDMQLTYLDEYLVHFPISLEFVPFEFRYPPEWVNTSGKMVVVKQDMGETWHAMEKLVDTGLTKTIGISNFSSQLIRQLLSTCRIRPSTLQVELHPHNSQERLVNYALQEGMKVTAYSTFGASSYIEMGVATDKDALLQDATIAAIGANHNKSPAQVLIRWALQRNTFPLTKSSNNARIAENRNVFDFTLSDDEMKQINSLNMNRRYNDPGTFGPPRISCPIFD